MGNLLSFGNHIEKKQTKAQYLAYEKGKILEETIYSFIEEIPNIPEEKIISYFTKIVKKEIPVMQGKYFHTRYVWNENHLKYTGREITKSIMAYIHNNKIYNKLLYHLSFLVILAIYFFKNIVNNFYRLSSYEYEKLGLRVFDKSIELKNTIRDNNYSLKN